MRLTRLITLLIGLTVPGFAARASEGVVLLHGLYRSPASMERMGRYLEQNGFVVLNCAYPSTTDSIEHLADRAIAGALGGAPLRDCSKIHFVTHSMGGLLVRSYFARHADPRLGRVVMLGPPNQGSEVVDTIGGWRLFRWLNGPAGTELGTSRHSTPMILGPVKFELGVIAGDQSINWINSFMILGADDGKVSVERTKVAGMKEHVTLHTTHPLMMKNAEVLRLTLRFLRDGTFGAR